ncbi:MAG: hypothetical protein BJ554DRAFT_5261, partial [Olpidium bornovanus]
MSAAAVEKLTALGEQDCSEDLLHSVHRERGAAGSKKMKFLLAYPPPVAQATAKIARVAVLPDWTSSSNGREGRACVHRNWDVASRGNGGMTTAARFAPRLQLTRLDQREHLGHPFVVALIPLDGNRLAGEGTTLSYKRTSNSAVKYKTDRLPEAQRLTEVYGRFDSNRDRLRMLGLNAGPGAAAAEAAAAERGPGDACSVGDTSAGGWRATALSTESPGVLPGGARRQSSRRTGLAGSGCCGRESTAFAANRTAGSTDARQCGGVCGQSRETAETLEKKTRLGVEGHQDGVERWDVFFSRRTFSSFSPPLLLYPAQPPCRASKKETGGKKKTGGKAAGMDELPLIDTFEKSGSGARRSTKSGCHLSQYRCRAGAVVPWQPEEPGSREEAVAAGALRGGRAAEPPHRREIGEHPFNHRVQLLFPAAVSGGGGDRDWEDPKAEVDGGALGPALGAGIRFVEDQFFYYCTDLPLSYFVTSAFRTICLRAGTVIALTVGRNIDTDDVVAIDGRDRLTVWTFSGTLILSLTKDTYEVAGLSGRPARMLTLGRVFHRVAVQVDLRSLTQRQLGRLE